MIATRNYKIGGAVVVPPIPSNIDEVLNSVFSNRYKASSSLNKPKTAPAAHLEEVGQLNDEIGGRPIGYIGNAVPNATGKQPILYKQDGFFNDGKTLDMVFLENESGIQYGNSVRQLSYPMAFGRVWMQPKYHLYEAYDNNTNRHYFGEAGGVNSVSEPKTVTLRFTTGEPNNVIDDLSLNYNGLNFILIKCFEDGLATASDRVSIKVWLNGVLLNPTKHLQTYKRNGLMEGFGADSNSEMHGVVEVLNAYKNLSQTEVDNVNAAVLSYYKIGQAVNLPYATNVSATVVNNIVSVNYTYVNPLGIPENTSATKVDWWYSSDGIQNGKFENSVKDLKSFNRTTTSGKFLNGQGIRVNVRPVDQSGNISWGSPAVWYGSFS